MRTIILSALLVFLLSSCGEKELSLNKICEQSDGLCNKIKTDGMCKTLRKDIIISNFNINNYTKNNVKESKSILQYKLLTNLEKYIICSRNAASIEYVDPKDKFAKQDIGRTKPITEKEKKERQNYIETLQKRKSDRNQNHNNAKIMLSEIETSIEKSEDQYLLYWKWSRMSSEKSIVKLLKLNEINRITNHNMLYFISQEQTKYNRKYAITSLKKSLENYPPDLYIAKELSDKDTLGVLTDEGRIHFSIFRSLVTLYMKEKHYDKAFIFSYLLKLNNDTSINIGQMKQYAKSNNSDIDFNQLINTAENLHSNLKDGKFKIQ
jgi:hypothetical protein